MSEVEHAYRLVKNIKPFCVYISIIDPSMK